MTWEDFGELKAWIDLAKLMLDSARRALENDDDSLFRKFVLQTQDALCEAVARCVEKQKTFDESKNQLIQLLGVDVDKVIAHEKNDSNS